MKRRKFLFLKLAENVSKTGQLSGSSRSSREFQVMEPAEFFVNPSLPWMNRVQKQDHGVESESEPSGPWEDPATSLLLRRMRYVRGQDELTLELIGDIIEVRQLVGSFWIGRAASTCRYLALETLMQCIASTSGGGSAEWRLRRPLTRIPGHGARRVLREPRAWRCRGGERSELDTGCLSQASHVANVISTSFSEASGPQEEP